MATLIEIKDALDEGLIGGALRKKLHLHEDIKGPLFPLRESSPPMMGMEPLLPSREPHAQSFRNSPEHTPEPDNEALEVPTETFIRYLNRHEKSEMERVIKSHIESIKSFEGWLAHEIAAGRIHDREEYYENYHYGSPYEELDHELTNFDHRLTRMGLLDYRKHWETNNKLSPVPYVLNEWFEEIARQYHPEAYVGFGGYVEIPESPEDADVPLVVEESTRITEQVHEGEDEEAEGISYTPFTKKEISILNFLAKNFTKEDLIQITTSTDLHPYSGQISKRWKDAMKLFGHTMPQGWGMMDAKAEASKYAKWAADNWREDKDYNKVTNPVKVLPKWYTVNYEETVSQVEFKSGDVDLIAFDEDDALNKGNKEFFDWGGETDIDDYGDSERFDHETTSAHYQRLAEEVIKETLREQERDKDSWSDEDLDGSEQAPFTPLESKILNILAKNFTLDELKLISTETYPYGPEQLATRWVDTMKLFGHSTSPGSGSMDEKVKTSKYAKWASDNWDFAQDVGGDYSKIKMPFKSLPKLYDVTYNETASQIEYRRGETEIVAFDEDDANYRGETEFYDWDGEVDTYDYGDQDVHDSEITDVKYKGLAESISSLSHGPKTDEEITQTLDRLYKDKFLELYRLYSIGEEHGRKLVGGVDMNTMKQFLKEIQVILYSNRWIDQWTGNPDVWQYTGKGYIPWDRSPFGRLELHGSIIRWAQSLLIENITNKKEYIQNAYSFLDETFPNLVPNEYYPHGEHTFNDAIRNVAHQSGLLWHEAKIVVDNFWREKRKEGKVTATGREEGIDEDKKRALTKGLLEEEEQKKVLKEIKPPKWPNQLRKMYEPFKDSLFKYWDNKGPHNDPHILKLLGLDTRKERGLYKIIDEWLVEWYGGRDKAIAVAKEKLKGIHQVIDGGYEFNYVVTSIDDATEEIRERTGNTGNTAENHIGVFVILDGSGTVNVALGGGDTYTLWELSHTHQWDYTGDYEEECRVCGLRRSVQDDSDDDLTRANQWSEEPSQDLKYEIQQEIDEVLHDNLTNLLNETGISIDYVTTKGTTRPDHFPPKEYIHEAADMFGQGLLEPIELQPYDTEEEWEEDVAKIEIPDDDEENDYEEEYEYEGTETDPAAGFVAPSRDVTENICKVRGFCKAQGPITFGQLKALVEAATNKRIASDIGRGIFKSLWRIIPFFLPQILFAAVGITATRALNKIITPALKDTKGYKRWWGKVVLKAMDMAEGDYIPDVALGDDPLSKIFFVSDGLLEMIRDKYKLKFARYVADVAASRPDDEPVPEWFVENLLRDYLNQKFLLDPPLGPKYGVDIKKTLREQREQQGIVVLLDGTSSAGKSFTLKYLDALPYWKTSDPNQWVVISSDDFSGVGGEERRLKLDHPNIRDWAEGNDAGIVSGLIRNDPNKENPPENPYEDEYIDGIDSRLWYMAQEFKTGPWKKVIFDDIGKDIIKYLPDVKFKHILLHTPIYMLLKNVKERNDRAVEEDSRNPEDVLHQYLKKYEATTTEPDINVGDPTTEITKGGLEDIFKEYNISEKFTEFFIDELGIKDEGSYWVKVKNEYLTPDIQLVNVGSDREEYLKTDTIKDIKKTLREQREEEVSPVLKHGDIVRPIDIPERKSQSSFGPPTPFGLYWVWHPSYGTPKREGDYIVVPIEDVEELQMSGHLRTGDEDEGLPGHLHRHLRVLSRSHNHQWLKAELSDEEKEKYNVEGLVRIGKVRIKRGLQEQREPEVSPRLYRGDIIKIIEKNDDASYLTLWTDYVVLTPLWHDGTPEEWSVIEGDIGWESRVVWAYNIIRKDLAEDEYSSQEQDMDIKLFKWLRVGQYPPPLLPLEEERQKNPSPELQEGDEIIVLRVDGTHENEPETFVPYKVIKRVREPRIDGSITYHIEPLSGRFPYWDDEKERWEVKNDQQEEGKWGGLWTMTTKIIYEVGDEWIFRPGFKREGEEILNEESQPISRPILKVGDVIKIIDNSASPEDIVDEDGYMLNDGEQLELFVNYVVDDIVYNNVAPTGRKRIKGDHWKGEIKGDIWGYGISNEEEKKRELENYTGWDELKASGPYQWIIVNKEEEISEDGELRQGKSLSPDQNQLIRGFDKWKNLKEHKEKVNPPIDVGDTITLITHEAPDIEYMTDEELKDFMENEGVKDTLEGDWHNFEETADLMGYRRLAGKGWYHIKDLETHHTHPDLFTPYRIIEKEIWIIKGGEGWRYLLLTLPEVNKREKMKGKGGLDYRWLYPSEVKYIISPPPKSLQEQDSKKVEVNPPLKPGDKIKVIDVDEDSDQRREFMNGMNIITSERFPKLYHTYTVIDNLEEMKWSIEGRGGGSPRYGWTRGYEGSGLDIDEGTQLLWLLMDKEEEEKGRSAWRRGEGTRGEKVGYKVIAPYFDKWIKVEEEVLQEQTEDKVNPQLMKGDEILVLSLDERNKGDERDRTGRDSQMTQPELYMPYVVTSVKSRQSQNLEGSDTDLSYYGIVPVDMTEEDTRREQAKGGSYRKIINDNDRWMFRPGFLRGELNEERQPQLNSEEKLNPQLRVGDEIKVVYVDREKKRWEVELGGRRVPELYTPYVITAMRHRQPENWESPDVDTLYYELEPIDTNSRDSLVIQTRLYPHDKWIYNPDFQREELNEQDFPFNLQNKKQERDHPEGEPPWSIRRGKQHYAMNVDPTPQEPVTAFNKYLVKNSPFNFLGFDYYLSAVPANMPGEARIDVYIPVLDDSATADSIWKDTLQFYNKKDNETEWAEDYEEFNEGPYYMEEIPMREVGYHATWPDYYMYEDFEELYPEATQEYKDRESDHLNPDGKVYETSWRERFNLVKDEMKELGKLFGLENTVINRDPGHPWKRQADSYGSDDIRPGTDVPYGWPRESEE